MVLEFIREAFQPEYVFSTAFFLTLLWSLSFVDKKVWPLCQQTLIPEFLEHKKRQSVILGEITNILSEIKENDKQIALNQSYILHELTELKMKNDEKSGIFGRLLGK